MPPDAFSPEQLAQISTVVKAAVHEAWADAGLRIDQPEHQDEAREDWRFLRKLRTGIDGLASKIGWAVIAAILGGVVWVVQLGLNAWKHLP